MKFFNLNLKDIAIIVLIIFILIGALKYFNDNNNWNNKLSQQEKLKIALQDSLRQYKNKEGEWVSEKKTLQADINTLKDKNLNLTENQKKLVSKVNKLENEKDLISAALIEESTKVDSLLGLVATNVDTIENTIEFKDSVEDLKYDLLVRNVKPTNLTPELDINNLYFPNEKFVDFSWGEKDEGYPISFSVTNSNKYFNTANIDSYAIPELQKPAIKPTGWQKVKQWFKRNGEKILIFLGGAGVGVVVGAAGG